MIENADLRSQIAVLKKELLESNKEREILRKENIKLKSKEELKKVLSTETPKTKWGGYTFGKSEQIHCIKCWESKGVKTPLTCKSSSISYCPLCEKDIPRG